MSTDPDQPPALPPEGEGTAPSDAVADEAAPQGTIRLGRSASAIGINFFLWIHVIGLLALVVTLHARGPDDPMPWERLAVVASLAVLPVLWRLGEKVTLTADRLSVSAPWRRSASVRLGPHTRLRIRSSFNLLRHVRVRWGAAIRYIPGSELSAIPAEWDAAFAGEIEARGLSRPDSDGNSEAAFSPEATRRYGYLRIRMEVCDDQGCVRIPPATDRLPELAAWLYRWERTHRYPELERRHLAGETLAFGDVTLTPTELRFGDRSLDLDLPIEVAIGFRSIRFWAGGERIFRTSWMFRGTGIAVPMRRIDHICCLIDLLRAQHGATFAPFHSTFRSRRTW